MTPVASSPRKVSPIPSPHPPRSTRTRSARTLGPALALALAAASALSACGSGSGKSAASTPAAATPAAAAVPAGAAGGASAGSAPPAVPLQQVEQLVAAAPSIKSVPAGVRPSIVDAPKDSEFGILGSHGCLPVYSTTSIDPAHCVFGDPNGAHTIVLLGDSHSAMWLPALDAVGQRIGWKVIDFNKVSCPAAVATVYLKQLSRPYHECATWINWVISEVNNVLKPSIFMTTSETNYKIVSGGSYQEGLTRLLQSITVPGVKKVVLGDMPYLAQDGPDCLAAHMSDVQACSLPESAAINYAGRSAEMAAAAASGAAYINVVPWFCSSICTAIVGNMIINQDGQHITRTYSQFLSGALQSALQPEVAAS